MREPTFLALHLIPGMPGTKTWVLEAITVQCHGGEIQVLGLSQKRSYLHATVFINFLAHQKFSIQKWTLWSSATILKTIISLIQLIERALVCGQLIFLLSYDTNDLAVLKINILMVKKSSTPFL